MIGDVILPEVKTLDGRRGCLYYFEGNFFYPILALHGSEVARVRVAIRRFIKANRALVDSDRARPGYLTLPEMFDRQMPAL